MLNELMSQRRSALAERWLVAILADYGEEAAKSWRRERDRFANPIGHTFATEGPKLIDAVSSDGDLSAAAAPLEAIIKIRSVQDFTPSRAVSFVFALRDITRAELAPEIARGGLDRELEAFDRRVERLALLAFDLYVQCRGQVFRLQYDELKRSVATLLRRWHGGELPEPASGTVALPPKTAGRR